MSGVSEELGFEITTRCPLKCAHCIVDSGPQRHEHVSIDSLKHWLSDTALNSLDTLVATGGEPFLFPKALEFISDAAHRMARRFRVITSASWARTLSQATRTLSHISIDHLIVSFDQYHEAYLPFDCAINAIIAATHSGVSTTVNVTAPMIDLCRTVRDVQSRLTTQLGAEMAGCVQVTGQPLLSAGRSFSAVYKGGSTWSTFDECQMVAKHIVKADGAVVACCGPPAYMTGPATELLTLGSLSNSSVADVLEHAKGSWLLRALRALGPAFLYELAGLPSRIGTVFDTRCSLCVDVLSDEACRTAILTRLEEPQVRRQISLATALKFGDLSLLELDLDTGWSCMKDRSGSA